MDKMNIYLIKTIVGDFFYVSACNVEEVHWILRAKHQNINDVLITKVRTENKDD